MANFWNLPRRVREKIYRLHLVREDPISRDQHDRIATQCRGPYPKMVPPLLAVSKKAEREAAPIYYGENHFDLGEVRCAWGFASETFTRHLRLMRKLTCTWEGQLAYEGFLAIARMRNLRELYIRVDEREMIWRAMGSRHKTSSDLWSTIRWEAIEEPTPQQQLSITKSSGFTGLLTVSGIPHVEFVKTLNWKKEECGGSIPGGFLETEVLPKLMGTGTGQKITRIGLDEDTFPFLSLPPEIRNRIYDLLLCIPGKIHPSTARPTSTPRKTRNQRFAPPTPDSALSLLAVNKQINNEAFGIFYHCNAFEFYYPTQLHAFLLSLGPERQQCLRDLTLHYYNNKVGGIDLAELTFPMLKQLPGLRRLHVLLNFRVDKLIRSNYFSNSSGWNVDKANPLLLPGIKTLFSLRGVTDVLLRFPKLETEFEEAKTDKEYPNFTAKSRKACVVKLTKALEHFNKALAEVQNGKVNKKLLDDPEWHMKDVFPTTDDEGEGETP